MRWVIRCFHTTSHLVIKCILLIGQEQAYTRITRLFVCSFVTTPKMAQYTGKCLLTPPLVITSKMKPFSRPNKTGKDEWMVHPVFCVVDTGSCFNKNPKNVKGTRRWNISSTSVWWNVFNMLYMKKKALHDLMYSGPPELPPLQVITQLDFVYHLLSNWEQRSSNTFSEISSCPRLAQLAELPRSKSDPEVFPHSA